MTNFQIDSNWLDGGGVEKVEGRIKTDLLLLYFLIVDDEKYKN